MQIKVIYHLLTLEIESIIQLHGKSRTDSINIKVNLSVASRPCYWTITLQLY